MAKNSAPREFTLVVGTRVRITALAAEGVITEALSDGSFKVTLSATTVRCRAPELSPPRSDKQKHSVPADTKPPIVCEAERDAAKLHSIDLHGLSVADALERVDRLIDRAVLAGLYQLEILHGIGSGRLQSALHAHLSSLAVVGHFKVDDFNRGKTIVYLK